MKDILKREISLLSRRLLREKRFTIINTAGLSIGIASALMILLFLSFETSYDRYHPDHETTYRIATDLTISGENSKIALNSLPIGALLTKHVEGIDSYLRVFAANFFFRDLVYRYNDIEFTEDGVFAVDSTFFDFFSTQFIHGLPAGALSKPYSIVLTETMSERYFGNANPLGEDIHLEGAGDFTVTAVVEDNPNNTHMRYSGLISMATMPYLDHFLQQAITTDVTWEGLMQSPGSRFVWVYVKTSQDFDVSHFQENIWLDFYREHIGDISGFDNLELIFQPLADIHLKSKLEYEMTPTGAVTMMSPENIIVFSTIAIFILILASINYANFSISRFNQRGKELGIMRIMGASKSDIIRQLFLESFLFAIISLFIALLIVELFAPLVNHYLGIRFSFNIFSNPEILLIITGVSLFTGLLSGLYPAIYYSRFSPLKILIYRYRPGRLFIKELLIVVQFTISIFMVIATLIVIQQLRFINHKDLGFDRDHLVVIELRDSVSRKNVTQLKENLLESGLVSETLITNYYPTEIQIVLSMMLKTEREEQLITSNIAQVSPDFLSFMGMEMSDGRFFRSDDTKDKSGAVVINETAVKEFGLENPLGKVISDNYSFPDGTNLLDRTIIGVIKDFHFQALTVPIAPMAIYPLKDEGNFLILRMKKHWQQQDKEIIKDYWMNFNPDYPLVMYSLDDRIDSLYNSQRVLSLFFAIFAVICLLIAFLGIFGLTAFTVEHKTKEIGVRKVLGGDFYNILSLLGRQFSFLILIACLISSAASWFFMNHWLDNFAYHTPLPLWTIIAGCLVGFVTAFIAIFFQGIRASSLNPTDALRYE